MTKEETGTDLVGHNIKNMLITVEARFFNSVSRFAGSQAFRKVMLPAGSTVGDLIGELAIPAKEIYLVLRNGKDVTPSLYGGINTETVLDEGDVVALSGPVPYSWGYGAPVV